MSTQKKIFKNVFASMLPQIVNIISSFILPVLIIKLYGSEINGLVSTIKNIISYISLVGAGISTAVIQSLYAPVANHESEIVKGMLKATADMFNKCGWIYLGIVALVSVLYPFIVKESISYFTILLLVIVMSISGASEFFVVGRCRALLYADQKVYVCTIIQALSLITSLIMAIIMLKLNAHIVLVQFTISFVYVVRAFLLSHYVKKNYPQYSFSKNTPSIKSAVAKRKNAMIHQLSGLFVFGSQSIILSIFVSLEAASIYAIYNIIFSGLSAICGNINTAITPFLGKTYATAQITKVRSEFNIVELSCFVLTVVIFSVTLKTILPFVKIYTNGSDIDYVYPLFAISFTIGQLFNIFRLPHSAMINVAGHFKETQNRALMESFICISFSLLFTYMYGMYGVLIGTGLAFMWRCLDMIIYVHKHILFDSIRLSLKRLLSVLGIISIVYFITSTPCDISNYYEWCMFAFKELIITLIVLFIFISLFERKSVKYLYNILRK